MGVSIKLSMLGAAVALLSVLFLLSSRHGDSQTRRSTQFATSIANCLKNAGGRLPQFGETIRIRNDSGTLPEGIISTESEPPFFELDMRNFVLYVAKELMAGDPRAKFEGVAINELPTEERRLNIYFLDCELESIAAGLHDGSSCAYVGFFNAIVCRTRYFERVFERYDRLDRTYDLVLHHVRHQFKVGEASVSHAKAAATLMKTNMTLWVLGHEIGHAVLHKELFAVSGQARHFSYQYNKEEEEADAFFANRLGNSKSLTALGSTIALNEFIEQEYRFVASSTVKGVEADDLNTTFFPAIVPIRLRVTPYDYPLLLRAVRIQSAILAAGLAWDTTGYPEIVSTNITVDNSPSSEVLLKWGGVGLGVLACLLAAALSIRNRQ